MPINGSLVNPIRTVRNLGVFIDSDLVMTSQVTRIVAQYYASFAVLRHLRLISRLLSPITFSTGGRRARLITIRLHKHSADWSARVLGQTLTVGAQCFGSSDLRTLAIRPCLRGSDVTALVAHPRTYSVQIGGPGPQRSSRQRSRIVEYLEPFTRLSDVPSLSSLRSSSSNHLLVPPVRRSTVGARAFPVAGPAPWNSLPAGITSIDSLPVFRHRRKNYLFS